MSAAAGFLGGPWGMGLSLGLQGLGALLGARKPGLQQLPPPNALFPQANASYTNMVSNPGTSGSPGGVGPQSIAALSKIFQTGGMPTDYSQLFSSTVSSGQRLQDIGRANLKESYGAQGLFHGTSMRDAAVGYESQSTKDLAQMLAQLAYSSNESAAGRYMGAAQTGAGMFSELGTAFTPSAAVTTGNVSGGSMALSQFGSSLQTLSMLAQMGLLGRK